MREKLRRIDQENRRREKEIFSQKNLGKSKNRKGEKKIGSEKENFILSHDVISYLGNWFDAHWAESQRGIHSAGDHFPKPNAEGLSNWTKDYGGKKDREKQSLRYPLSNFKRRARITIEIRATPGVKTVEGKNKNDVVEGGVYLLFF